MIGTEPMTINERRKYIYKMWGRYRETPKGEKAKVEALPSLKQAVLQQPGEGHTLCQTSFVTHIKAFLVVFCRHDGGDALVSDFNILHLELDFNPMQLQLFGDRTGRVAAKDEVENDIAWMAGCQYHSVKQRFGFLGSMSFVAFNLYPLCA